MLVCPVISLSLLYKTQVMCDFGLWSELDVSVCRLEDEENQENMDPEEIGVLARRDSRGELMIPQPYCRIYTRNTKEVTHPLSLYSC